MLHCVLLLPCSTIQAHREVASIGVWPGYTCFDRDEAESPALTPDELRQRFGLVDREDVVALSRRKVAAMAVTGRIVGRVPRHGEAVVLEATVMR